MPPARSSAQDFRRGGDEGGREDEDEDEGELVMVVYGAMRGCRRKSMAVSCVRKDVPA